MNTVENALLQQMQKLASSFSAVPGAGNKSQNNQSSVSFQEMLQQSGNKTSSSESAGKEPQDKPLKEAEEALEEAKSPELPVKQKDEEELKAENLTGNPNAVGIMDLFRPEIVENVEQAGTVVNPIPQETVEGGGMDLGDQAPAMDTGVDAGIGAEVSMEQQPKDFQQAMEEAPQQPMADVPPAGQHRPVQIPFSAAALQSLIVHPASPLSASPHFPDSDPLNLCGSLNPRNRLNSLNSIHLIQFT